MKRTQILLPDDLHRKLRRRARAGKTSMGHLIRQAVEKAYGGHLEEMALTAYRTGLISIGKLAEISGMPPSKALDLLHEQGIAPLLGPETRDEALRDARNATRSR